jgi:hypothetical protein
VLFSAPRGVVSLRTLGLSPVSGVRAFLADRSAEILPEGRGLSTRADTGRAPTSFRPSHAGMKLDRAQALKLPGYGVMTDFVEEARQSSAFWKPTAETRRYYLAYVQPRISLCGLIPPTYNSYSNFGHYKDAIDFGLRDTTIRLTGALSGSIITERDRCTDIRL